MLTNAGEEDKNQTWLSNTQNKKHSAGKVRIGVTNELSEAHFRAKQRWRQESTLK